MISEDDIRKVREASDIVQLIGERVVLKRRGREFWGCCPFHNEKTPSFKVDPASQLYHCFGCGEGGDAFKFLIRIENMEFPDAVRYLAQKANVEIIEERDNAIKSRRTRLYEVCEQTAGFYHRQLMRTSSKQTDAARSYLSSRGFGGDIPKLWQLGYAPGSNQLVQHLKEQGYSSDEMVEANVALLGSNGKLRDRFYDRVMFPISDLQGRVVAFGGRIIGKGEPKYINTAESPLFHKRDNLYAIDRAKAQITTTGTAIIVEGYTDVIAMHKVGLTNTVATLGTALTPQHLKLLTRFAKKVVYLFDGDEAGRRAADRASELIGRLITPEAGPGRVDLLVAVLPQGKDPADYCASEGLESLKVVLDSAQPLLRFALDRRLEKWDLALPEQRIKALDDVIGLLVPVRGSLLATDYLNYLSDVFLVDYQTVSAALERAKAPDTAAVTEQAPQSFTQTRERPMTKQSELERELLALFIQEPASRTRLNQEFSTIQWCDELHAGIAESLRSAKPDTSTTDIIGRLSTEIPEATTILGAAQLNVQDAAVDELMNLLLFSLSEERLIQRIRSNNAILRQADRDSVSQPDQLFEETARLQQQLNSLRKGYNESRK